MTYAIFKAAGFQYRAQLGDVLRLPSLDVESGDTVTFDEVLLGSTEGEVLIGRPTLTGAAVRAEVLRHGRADKIVVFKFKRRKSYRRKTGHRQNFTEVLVKQIDLGGDRVVSLEPEEKPKKAPAKKKTEAKVAAKPKKAAAKTRKAPAKKAAAKKTTTTKKKAPKKAAAKKTTAKAKKTTAKAKTASKSKKKKS